MASEAAEPRVQDSKAAFVRNSFLFLPAVGVRNAPEELLLDLFRSIFFEEYAPKGPGKPFAPPRDPLEGQSPEEHLAHRLSIAAGRGRFNRKRGVSFYAPLYPQLAQYGWLRSKADKAANRTFLEGPIAHALGGSQSEVATFSRQLVRSLTGSPDDREHLDLLARASSGTAEGYIEEEDKVADKVASVVSGADSGLGGFNGYQALKDPFSEAVVRDLRWLLELEERIPRIFWIKLFSSFLSSTSSLWLLGRMKVVIRYHARLMSAMEGEGQHSQSGLKDDFLGRMQRLLHVGEENSDWLFSLVDDYTRARVETWLIFIELAEQSDQFKDSLDNCKNNPRLMLENPNRATEGIGMLDVLDHVGRSRGSLFSGNGVAGLRTQASEYKGWLRPRKRGHGKNMDEFFRVLRHDPAGDERGGHLLEVRKRGGRKGLRIANKPGPVFLLMNVYFAQMAREEKKKAGGQELPGPLFLRDLEDQLNVYGVDCHALAAGRAYTRERLAQLGLLSGSPDAGENVALGIPFS